MTTINNQDQNVEANNEGVTEEQNSAETNNEEETVQEPVLETGEEKSKPAPESQSEMTTEQLRKLPQVSKLMEEARSQEKQKLYKTLENKETELTNLKTEIEELKTKLRDKENENLSEVEILQKEIRELNDKHNELQEKFVSEQERAEKEKKDAELAAYKERRLREEGEELVTSLVGGNSEEEIEQSIELAKTEYQNIFQKALSNAESQMQQEETTRRKEKVNNTSRVTNPSTASELGLTREEIKKMSPEQWKAVRDKAIDAAKEGLI